MFEHLSGTPIAPVTQLRIELRVGTNVEDVKRFEEWLNGQIETIAFGK